MKLLYIANARVPTEKAHGLQIFKMCEAFANQGHQVTLVIPWRFGRLKVDPYQYYGAKHNFRIKQVFSLDLISILGALGFFLQVLTFAISSALYSMFVRPDIIYGRDEVALWSISFLNPKIVWEIHTKKLNWFARKLLVRAKALVTISGGLRDLLLKAGASKEKILVSHDGVDVSEYESSFDRDTWRLSKDIPLEAKVIAYVGALHTMGKGKGVEELIDIFPEILKREPDAFLLLTGMSEGDRNEAVLLCDKRGISRSRVRIDSAPSQKETVEYFRSADVHIMNFPNTEHYALYMSPLKMFSYMASGVPIVTTDLPSIREVLSDKEAEFVPAGDSDKLIEVILRVLSGSEEVRSKARAGEVLVQEYSWNARAINILNFLSLK